MNETVVKYEANSKGRDFVVGDLHGHYDLLQQALDKVGFDIHADRLFSVGDLIDRGPESLKCLTLVQESWFYAVRGNHEVMLEDALFNNENPQLWLKNGGDWILNEDRQEVEELARKVLPRMPYAIEVMTPHAQVGIVHAEPPQDWALLHRDSKLDISPLLWARQRIASKDRSLIKNIDRVYVGHTPIESPRTLGNVRYIDTGAFNSTILTMERFA
ncbi:metallophosphoesterase [Phytohalomonas tamaricis]|uniref:metallophosphoesterase n=1 Tax=Phytohalomonas tamaricis TaxID=2081032 RepID=UPI000D0B6391|nr:metallophosphoesterase [Phytohalomonas tamaricis]